jgi:YVTN family beta-propeller protein
LEFRILGPLEATRGERALALGSPKQRALLAFLLLHANELVSRERLIEELWGDAAPATVNAVLNVYLTRLRRLLANGGGDETLTTRAPGYVLALPEQRLDARRFEALLEQGRDALQHGDARQAAATLRAALALWRGPALADLAYEPFAQNEIRRLEELRLAALEDRIEAELALAQHERLVAELEALVREHPYRERLHAQLMLALYRSGRQADALDAYRRARRTLADELGIEPGPRLQQLERAILRQDRSLEPPSAPPPPADIEEQPGRRTARRWRPPSVALLAVGLIAVVVVVSAFFAVQWDGSPAPRPPIVLRGDSVAVVDAETASVVEEIPVGARPSGIAVGEGAIWVGNRDDNTLLRIDPRSREIVRTIGLAAEPREVVVAAGGVWITTDSENVVLRVDPDINDVVASIRVRPGGPVCCRPQLAAGGGTVWVAFGGALTRIDSATNTAVRQRDAGVEAIAYGEGALWLLTDPYGPDANRIERIDPRSNEVTDSIPRGRVGQTGFGGGLGVGAGAVWTAPYLGTTLWKIDPASGRFTGSARIGRPPAGVDFGEQAVWVVRGDGTLLRIDPTSGRVTKTIRLGVYPANVRDPIAVDESAVWIAVTR